MKTCAHCGQILFDWEETKPYAYCEHCENMIVSNYNQRLNKWKRKLKKAF